MAEKTRIAWFSALNIGARKTASPSAHFTDEVLPLIAKECDVDCYHDGFEKYGEFPTYHFLSAADRHKENPYDLFFYQLDDLSISRFVRTHIGLMPGVVLFHDFLLTDDGPDPLLNSPWIDVVNGFNARRGDATTWPERNVNHKRLTPFAYREGAFSLVSIFSSERSVGEFRRHIEWALTSELKFETLRKNFYLPYPVDATLANCAYPRFSMGGKAVIGYCGSPRIEHRSHKLFEALASVDEPIGLLWLIDQSEKEAAEELLREFGIQDAELIVGRSPSAWHELLPRMHIAAHTLFSVFGQPGVYLSMSLMAGKPSLVTNFGVAEFLPESVVCKIEPGVRESLEIQNCITALIRDGLPGALPLAMSYARELFDTRVVAYELMLILKKTLPYVAQMMREWSYFEHCAAKALVREVVPAEDERFLATQSASLAKLVRPVFQELGWVE